MGATVYYERPKEFSPTVFRTFGDDVRRLIRIWTMRTPGAQVCGSGGQGEPEISDEMIRFNDVAAHHQQCEDFFFPRLFIAYGGIPDGFGYCKTRTHAYRSLVVAALLLARYYDESVTIDARALPPEARDLAVDLVESVRGERPPAMWLHAG